MCQKLGCLVSNLLYFAEKFAVWIAGVSLVGCIILTLIMMLALGIGLGYNYCYVDYQTRSRYRYVPPHYQNVTNAPRRRFGDNILIENMITDSNNSQNELTYSLPPILKTISEENNGTYFETYSTTISSEVIWTKLIYNASGRRTPKLMNHYKFWAVPNNITVTNKTKIKGIDATLGKPTRTTFSSLFGLDPVKSSEELPEGTKSNAAPQNKLVSINGMDLLALLSQLRAENRNYSLQILTS